MPINNNESSDGDFNIDLIVELHEMNEVEIDRDDFWEHVDQSVEWVGNNTNVENIERANSVTSEDEDPPLNFEIVHSLSNSEDEEGGMKKKEKQVNIQNMGERPKFYVGEIFGDSTVFKDAVKKYSILTRRKLNFVKNDKIRMRVNCYGNIASVGEAESSVCGSKKRKRKGDCPWVLHVYRSEHCPTWVVKTFVDEHLCLQLLTTCGVDPNNGSYPVAYALVEAETKDSWEWFLTCIGDDLEWGETQTLPSSLIDKRKKDSRMIQQFL